MPYIIEHITLIFMVVSTAIILSVDLVFYVKGIPTISSTIRDYAKKHYWPLLLFIFLGLHFFWEQDDNDKKQ